VTESEWLNFYDPARMLVFVQGKLSNRQLRLFGCACVRLTWALVGKPSPSAVETAEMFADNFATKAALRRARGDVRTKRHALDVADVRTGPQWGAYWLTEVVASENAYGSVLSEMIRLSEILLLDRNAWSKLCGLLRDVYGNPFQRVIPNPQWRKWNDATVLKIAEGMYADRAFDRMPILHDALLDASCADEALLSHCRNPEGHVRGCWAIDLILDKH
jgi:hypothetical protein